jgi:hypothetical protein
MISSPRLILAVTSVLLAVFTAGSCAQLSQIKASISGTCYMDGRPIQGTVLLLDAAGTQLAQNRTTLSGHFQLKDITAGEYQLQFLNMQGVPFGEPVKVVVRLGRPEMVDIQLTASDRMQFH